MKTILTQTIKYVLIAILALGTFVPETFSQAPDGFAYQAVVRDNAGDVVADQAVGLYISINQTTADGSSVYVETHSATTDAFGLVSLSIGTGTVVSGVFADIDWSTGPYFVSVAMDVTGGQAYMPYGATQLMSVPYALYAKTAGNASGGGGTYTAGPGITIIDGVIMMTDSVPPPPDVLVVGDVHEGGVVIYLDASGEHGIVAAMTDILDESSNPKFVFFNNGKYHYADAGTKDNKAIGFGPANTAAIIAAEGPVDYETTDILVSTEYAAQIADEYTYTDPESGITYDDWYLPTLDEVFLIQIAKDNGFITNLILDDQTYNRYWTSTEYGDGDASSLTPEGVPKMAWRIKMDRTGGSGNASAWKYTPYPVRPCRSF